MKTVGLLATFLFFNGILNAQNGSAPGKADVIQVYLDCDWFCDMDFIRTEIDYVDYVRDQFLANVYILATEQSTGGGGNEVKLMFQGQGAFERIQDTLTFYRNFNDTDDEFRQDLIRYLSAGLMPYLARTPRFENIRIGYERPEGQGESEASSNTPADNDPWNFWIFRTSISGYGSGDNIYQSWGFEGELEGSRVTEDWKHYLSLSAESSNDIYEYEDDEGQMQRLENPNHHYQAFGYSVKSLTDHWSAGTQAELEQSTFRNYRMAAQGKVAVEYNVFPYKQSNQRLLSFQYFIGTTWNKYYATTIYEKDAELLFEQEFDINLNLVQKWGELYASIYWENYLHNFKFNNLNGFVSANIRLFKGFAFNVAAGASIIHNQLNIQKGDISENDVLIRRRQLETSFDYWINFGINYTFGSMYNNVVNPRFSN